MGWWLTGAMAAGVIASSVYARLVPLFPGDVALALLVQSAAPESTDAIMRWVSFFFGGRGAIPLMAVAAVLVWWRIGGVEALMVPVSGISVMANEALKEMVGRPRPVPDVVRVLVEGQGSSFPSGHACFAIAVVGMLAYLVASQVRTPAQRWLVLCGAIVVALAVGVSRVYLGVHWPSDVVGGYVFGGLFLIAQVRLYRACRAK